MLETILRLRVQSLEIAVRASDVREVLGERRWVALPGARPELPGIMAWAGRAVVVLDLARLGPELRPLPPREPRARTLLLETRGSALAIPADAVSEVYEVDSKDIRPRHVTDFRLATHELETNEQVLPLLEPALLVEQASRES